MSFNIRDIYSKNPETKKAWDGAGINAPEPHYNFRAKPGNPHRLKVQKEKERKQYVQN